MIELGRCLRNGLYVLIFEILYWKSILYFGYEKHFNYYFQQIEQQPIKKEITLFETSSSFKQHFTPIPLFPLSYVI